MLDVENLWTIGNHGIETIDPSGVVTVDPAVARYAEPIRRVAQTLEPVLDQFDGVALENKEWTLTIHYRLADDAIIPRLQAVVEHAAERSGLVVMKGKKVFEVRPPVNIDKGTAIQRLARQLGGFNAESSVLFAGDDTTDEDAFRMLRADLPHAITIHVGDDPNTAAEFTLATPAHVRALLERIAHDTSHE